MAARTTYIYRVEMGTHPKVKETVFCYARNNTVALENIKKEYRSKRYNMFKAYNLGIARESLEPFKLLEGREEAYFRSTKSNIGEKYSMRKEE